MSLFVGEITGFNITVSVTSLMTHLQVRTVIFSYVSCYRFVNHYPHRVGYIGAISRRQSNMDVLFNKRLLLLCELYCFAGSGIFVNYANESNSD